MSALMYQDYDPVREYLHQYKMLVKELQGLGSNPPSSKKRSINQRTYTVLELFSSLVNHLLAEKYLGMRIVAFGVNHAETVMTALSKQSNPKIPDIFELIVPAVDPDGDLVTFSVKGAV